MTDILQEAVIIKEVRRAGREVLFDISHKRYKDKAFKNSIWSKIALVPALSGTSGQDCQKIWLKLKAKHMSALFEQRDNINNTSKIDLYKEWLLEQMEFLTPFLPDLGPPACKSEEAFPSKQDSPTINMDNAVAINGTSNDLTFDNLTKMDDILEKWRSVTECSKVLIEKSAVKDEVDPFVELVQHEMKKVPKHKVNQVKLKILETIYNFQN